MKIGIITFFNVPNYGAMLQAYAMQTYLEDKGCEVVFINCDYICRPKFPLWRVLLSRSVLGLKLKMRHNSDRKLMCGFTNKLNKTRKYSSYSQLSEKPPECDIYLCGSDQMWNPAWCIKDMDTVFLNFGSESAKRASYAVSFGSTKWPEESQSKFIKLLGEVDEISTREQSGVELIRELTDQTSEWLPDPTLLHDMEFYKELITDNRDDQSHYCFRYALDWDKGCVDKYQSVIQKILGLSLVKDQHNDKGTDDLVLKLLGIKKKVSVEAWLKRIANADFVLTDSFHGTVFAILFRKPFIAVLIQKGHALEEMNERIVSLLKRLGLEQRMFSSYDELTLVEAVKEPIDWDLVFQHLD